MGDELRILTPIVLASIKCFRYQTRWATLPSSSYTKYWPKNTRNMRWPSHLATTAFVIVAQILTLGHFSCFQHINFNNWLFTCWLMCTTSWQVQQENQCCSLHLSLLQSLNKCPITVLLGSFHCCNAAILLLCFLQYIVFWLVKKRSFSIYRLSSIK